MDYGSKMSKQKWLNNTQFIVAAFRIIGALLVVVAKEAAHQFGFGDKQQKGGARRRPK